MTTPGIKKRGTKYQGTYRGPDGRERTKTFVRKIDAKNWIEDERSKIVRGEWIDPRSSRITLEDFARPWLERRPVSVRTKELYTYLLDRHTLPSLGATPLRAILPSTIEGWNAKLASAHPVTAAKSYRLLSQVMKAAVRDKLISSNPCQIPRGGAESPSERPTASIAEVDALAEGMPEHLRMIVLVAAWCQLRRGELLGLRRRDIDPLRGTLTVSVTRTKLMSGQMISKAPKSDAGKRTLAIPPHVMPIVNDHLKRFVEGEPNALVFCGEMGGPLSVGVLNSAWHRARAGIDRNDLRLHDLRHSGLTWSAATGATIAELMKRAGHSSAVAAMRYQHATEDRDRVLADALSALPSMTKVSSLADKARTAGESTVQSKGRR